MLEAQERIGGRVLDDTSFGRCVSLGAMIVTGICNNPITTLCKQVRRIALLCIYVACVYRRMCVHMCVC